MKAYCSKDMKRLNYLVSEIDATYHELALKLGISDSVMTILYTICDNGESCPLQEICHRQQTNNQFSNPQVGGRRNCISGTSQRQEQNCLLN